MSGMHSTVAKPTDLEVVDESKELWQQTADPALESTQKMLQTITFKLGNFDDENRSFQAVASTPLVDRQGDSIEQSGWVLDNFIKNPVIPWAHIYCELPVARATEIGVVDGNLQMTVQFPPEGMYEFADTVYNMYRHQFMFAFSVGFIPLEYDGNWEDGYNFTKCELLEVSAVPVPANAGALVLAQKMGVMDNKSAKQFISKTEAALKTLKEANGLNVKKELPKETVDKTVEQKVDEKVEQLTEKAKDMDKEQLKSALLEVLEEMGFSKKSTEEASSDSNIESNDNEDLTNVEDMGLNNSMTEQKSGSKLSQSSRDTLKAVMDGLDKIKAMADEHIATLQDLHDSGAPKDNSDSDSDNADNADEKKTVSTTKVDGTKEVVAEAKAADTESEEGAEQEKESQDEPAPSEEPKEEDPVEEPTPEVPAETPVETPVEAPAEEEPKEEPTEPEAEKPEEVEPEGEPQKGMEDLIDPENLSDDDVAKLTAAVQAELEKLDKVNE